MHHDCGSQQNPGIVCLRVFLQMVRRLKASSWHARHSPKSKENPHLWFTASQGVDPHRIVAQAYSSVCCGRGPALRHRSVHCPLVVAAELSLASEPD